MKIPLAICLFTSTKGHWDIKDRYLQTLNHINNQIPLKNFAGLYANIKIDEDADIIKIAQDLTPFGFNFKIRQGNWKHGEQSHQNEYLADIFNCYSDAQVLDHQYCLHLEDDWLLEPAKDELVDYIHKAIKILEESPDILQVRFPRFSNEIDRINNLKAKHGIDAKATKLDDIYFTHNDFSLNPSIFRTRDLRTALILMSKNSKSFPVHVEHGLGQALKYFSSHYDCLAAFNPEEIRAYHIGTPKGQEDKLGVVLNSN